MRKWAAIAALPLCVALAEFARAPCYSKSVLVEERGPSVARRVVPSQRGAQGERGSPRRNRPAACAGPGWWRKAKTSSLSFGPNERIGWSAIGRASRFSKKAFFKESFFQEKPRPSR